MPNAHFIIRIDHSLYTKEITLKKKSKSKKIKAKEMPECSVSIDTYTIVKRRSHKH